MPTWNDYELIDSGNLSRLERFGEFTIVRPEPNAIWERENPNHPAWEKPDALFDGEWDVRETSMLKGWKISWKKIQVLLKLTSFRHVGMFPEQESQWNTVQKWVEEKGKGVKLLNLFAYTGLISLAAASAGAEVTHVDASKGSVSWARENADMNAISTIRWIVEDVRKFVEREVRRGNAYDIIVLDPPVFGRGPKGEIWRLEDEFTPLIQSLKKLSHQGTRVLINIYATTTYPESFKRVVEQVYAAPGNVLVSSTLLTESNGKNTLQTGYSLKK